MLPWMVLCNLDSKIGEGGGDTRRGTHGPIALMKIRTKPQLQCLLSKSKHSKPIHSDEGGWLWMQGCFESDKESGSFTIFIGTRRKITQLSPNVRKKHSVRWEPLETWRRKEWRKFMYLQSIMANMLHGKVYEKGCLLSMQMFTINLEILAQTEERGIRD